MLANGLEIIRVLEQLAPKHYALPDDKIGLQLGTLRGDTAKALVTLEVTQKVVEEAIDIGAKLIIAHHAIIYRPLKHLQTDTPSGKMLEQLIKNDIAVYIAHTNLDTVKGGMGDMMADALGLESTSPLVEGTAGAPGLGRIGNLSTPMTLLAFAEHVKQALDVAFVRVTGDDSATVHKVAVLGGSGSSFMSRAIEAEADVYVSGDIDYHTAQDALASGLSIVDPGHHAEKIMKSHIAEFLQRSLVEQGYTTEAIASAVDTEPFRVI